MRDLILFFSLLLSITILNAQNICRNVNVQDSLNNAQALIDCDYPFTEDGGIRLQANYTESFSTESYVVESVSYAPQLNFDSGVLVNIASDDTFSDIIPLPFEFCYFGESFSSIVIGDNGLVSFDTSLANGDSPFYSSNLPNPALFNNTIYALYHDITNDDNVFGCTNNPDTNVNECGEIRYDVTGTAPCRKFIVNFNQLNHFNDEDSRSTFQLILYEGSNEIEIQIANKPINNETTPTGAFRKYATIGIQNANGYQAYYAEGRNNEIFATSNEAWRFKPDGSSIVEVEWFDANNNLIGTGDNIVVYTEDDTTIRAEAIYNYCNNNSERVSNEFAIIYSNAYPRVEDLSTIVCDELEDGEEVVNLMDFSLTMVNNPYEISVYNSFEDAENAVNPIADLTYTITSNQTFFIRLEQYPDCFDVGMLTLQLKPRPTIINNSIAICDINNDNNELLQLQDYVPSILGVSSNADAAFYLNISDAENANNAITEFILNSTSNLYFAASFGNSCETIDAIQFSLTDAPEVPETIAVNICDNISRINLNDYLPSPIAANYSNIRYFRTIENAFNNTNRITNPGNFTVNSVENIYVRVQSAAECFSIGTLVFNYFESPEVVLDKRLQCDTDENEMETFDLTLSIPDMIESTNGISISYFLSQAGAQENNPEEQIANPNAFTIPISNISVWVRFENEYGCVSVERIKLFAVPIPEIQQEEFDFCDADQDSIEIRLLSTMDDEIIGGQVFVENIYYATEEDAIAQINPIETIEVAPTVTVYVRMVVIFEDEEYCSDIFPVYLSLILIPTGVLNETVTLCDVNTDGVEEINLHDYAYMSGGVESNNVEFLNENGDVINNFNYTIENGTFVTAHQINNVGCHPDVVITFNLIPSITASDFEHFICDDSPYNDEVVDLVNLVNNNQPSLLSYPHQFYRTEQGAINQNANRIIANPNSFVISQPVKYAYLRIEAENGCYSLITITIHATKSPELNSNEVILCDYGNDSTEFVNTSDLNQSLYSNYTSIQYYLTANDAQNQQNSIEELNVQNGTVLYVVAENTDNITCTQYNEVTVILAPTPSVAPIQVELCDNNNDGVEAYDLTIHEEELFADYNNASFTYFHSFEDAENNNNPINNPNQINLNINENVYFVKVEDLNSCGAIGTISFQFNVAPTVNNTAIGSCDEDFNLVETFNLLDYTSEITSDTSVSISFYRSYLSATTENADQLVTNPENYTTSNLLEMLYARVEDSHTGCFSVAEVSIEIYKLPKIVDTSVSVCDLNLDGLYDISLPEIDPQIIEDYSNYSFEYYESYANAMNQMNMINTEEMYQINDFSEGIYARVINNYGCASITFISFYPSESSSLPNLSDVLLEDCDDDTDGHIYFDLEQVHSFINSETSYDLSFFETIQDAKENNNPIEQPSQYLNNSTTQTIFVRYQEENLCAVIDRFSILVNALPINPFLEDIKKCPEETVTLDAGAEAVQYLWNTGETTRTIAVSQSGSYSVTLTNEKGCSETFNINVSNYPSFTIDYTFTGQNSVVFDVIETVDDPDARYQFSLDLENWQNSNVYFNLEQGVYTIYVRNIDTECIVELPFLVFDWNNMITPNGDGINDTWNECGLEVFGEEMSKLTIFDRYGKEIYSKKSNSCFIWDGKYQGRALPTESYWFIVQLPDGRKFSGYIAIKNYNNGDVLR